MGIFWPEWKPRWIIKGWEWRAIFWNRNAIVRLELFSSSKRFCSDFERNPFWCFSIHLFTGTFQKVFVIFPSTLILVALHLIYTFSISKALVDRLWNRTKLTFSDWRTGRGKWEKKYFPKCNLINYLLYVTYIQCNVLAMARVKQPVFSSLDQSPPSLLPT